MTHEPENCEANGFIGRAALATDEDRLAALKLVRSGAIMELGQVLRPHAPHYSGVQPPFLMNLWTTAQGVIRALARKGITNAPGVNLEHASMTFHAGTHVDSLGHFTAGQHMYGGRSADKVIGDLGLYDLGAEMIPVIIARAVLLDVAKAENAESLAGGQVVTRQLLQAAETAAGTRLGAGDVALIRTGWGQFYRSDPVKYVKSEPGLDLDAARYLTEAGVIAIGADNMAVEVMPGTDPKISMPVHQHTLVECGVYLIENLDLEALAASGYNEICFVMLAIRIKGATGTPARPIALL
ncbi:cyclase family protein [Rhodobacteraceae bacterium LMO-12]|nr:cyclase family protein [Rhodobacteraceae bacterium LMO-JJ12]